MKLIPEESCEVQRVDLICATYSDVKGVKRKMVTPWCGFMSQSSNYTVLAATLSYFTFLWDVNKVNTLLCPYVEFPKILQFGVGFLSTPLPEDLSIGVCLNRERQLLIALWTLSCAVPCVSQEKLVLILCAGLILVSVTVRHFQGSIKLLWLWVSFLQCSTSCSS